MPTESESSRPLQPAALHILLALGRGERHGYALIGDVDALSEGAIRLGPGTLYGTIKRLLADGLIRESGMAAKDERRTRRGRVTTPIGEATTSIGEAAASIGEG